MSVFFNGRLFVTPATMSAVDDSLMSATGQTVGNVLAVVGKSGGGKPKSEIRIGSAVEAKKMLISGESMKAIEKAFDPSSQTSAPSTIIFVRVDPATQSSLDLKAADNQVAISLKSTDYGAYTNNIKVKVESGTTKGLKLTTQLGNDYASEDNIFRDMFSVAYSGIESAASITINGSQILLYAPANNVVATIDLSTFDTVQKVVDRISATTGFSASAVSGSEDMAVVDKLDWLTGRSVIGGGVTVTANLQAAIDWFNSAAEGYVTATRGTSTGLAPSNTDWLYLSGAITGSATNTDWSDAFAALQTMDVQHVAPISSSAAIHAMSDSHCAFMSNVVGMERRNYCGTALATSDDDAIAASKALNSDRTALVHLGFYDYDDNGDLTLYPPYILSAMIAGAFAGSNPGTSMTNKSLKIRGLERKLRNPTDTDKLIIGGVLCVEDRNDAYKVVKSISTWRNNSKYNRVEISTGIALDYTSRSVREALDDLRGEKGTPILLQRAINIVDTVCRGLALPDPVGPGVLAGDADNPAYRNIQASIEGDILRVQFECSPVVPVNYIPVTIFAKPFSGSASA